MTALFFQPPPEQRVGGLDAAIQAMRAALERQGVKVDEQLPNNESADHVAHFHGLWQPAHAKLARECIARGIPYIVSPHGMLEPWAWRHKWWKKWPYFHLVEKNHLRQSACVLATAQPEGKRLREMLPGQRVEVMPLGLTGTARPSYAPARTTLGWRDEDFVLLFLSRIHEKKGLDLLFHALAQQEKLPHTRVVVVGGGEPGYIAALKRLAESLRPKLPPIEWIGEVWGEDRWKYFQGADLFCLPSHSENFGLAVLEACQVGTPALTTTTTPWAGELPEGLGYICDPNSDSVTGALTRFFSTGKLKPEQRASLSDWAWSRYDWDALAGGYIEIYKSLCAR